MREEEGTEGKEGNGGKREETRTASGGRNVDATQGKRRLTWKEEREVEGLEARIEGLEARREGLQTEINACGDDYLRLQELAELLQALETELDDAMMRWLELAER